MIAALPMYDRPETAGANDAFWTAIREALGHGPTELTRDRDLWSVWTSGDLVFAQTCGLPYRAHLHEQVQLVATPDYGLPGCPTGFYNSVLVVRQDDPAHHISGFEGRTLAYNEPLSQSGWAAAATYAARYDVAFGAFLQTGAHAASARAVAEGQADIAAIDALTWALLQRYDGFTANLRALDRTTPTPALPYICALSQDVVALRNALHQAMRALGPAEKETLGLRGVVDIPKFAYLEQPLPPEPPNI